jgi:shikimate kinase
MSESEQASPAGTRFEVGGDNPRIAKPIVLVGLMGAGKTSIGRRLAGRLDLSFIDADSEIEAAAGCSIEEIFERHGEAAFRDGERRVIARLLDGPPCVIATGGGAYMDPTTRALIGERAISLWLRADLDTLVNRTSRRSNRPLLKQGPPRDTLDRLMQQRYPVYAEADLTVDSRDCPPDETTDAVLAALIAYLDDCEAPRPVAD